MPPALQVYLLRVLETGSVVRVGGNQEIAVDVRIVAATNRIADDCSLRQDLFYRLGHYLIELPPLRARGDDVQLLARRFIAALDARHEGQRRQLDPACIERLQRHSWPGNVRELRAATERAWLASRAGLVDIHPLCLNRQHADKQDPAATVQFRIGTPLQDIEDEMLRRTLAFHGGDKTATARSLGVSVRTIHNHLARLRLHG